MSTTGPIAPIARPLSQKSQVIIPLEIRKYLQVTPGEDNIEFVVNSQGEVIVQRKEKSDLMSLFGSLPPQEPVTKAWDDIRKEAIEEHVRSKYDAEDAD